MPQAAHEMKLWKWRQSVSGNLTFEAFISGKTLFQEFQIDSRSSLILYLSLKAKSFKPIIIFFLKHRQVQKKNNF